LNPIPSGFLSLHSVITSLSRSPMTSHGCIQWPMISVHLNQQLWHRGWLPSSRDTFLLLFSSLLYLDGHSFPVSLVGSFLFPNSRHGSVCPTVQCSLLYSSASTLRL
jgi:hypothetical protein